MQGSRAAGTGAGGADGQPVRGAGRGGGQGAGQLGVRPRLPLTWSPPSSQEAHKMVREANMKQAASEKQLKETRGKVRHAPAQTSCPPLSPASAGLRHPIGPSHGLGGQQGGAEASEMAPLKRSRWSGSPAPWDSSCVSAVPRRPFWGPFQGLGGSCGHCNFFSSVPYRLYKAETSGWLCEPGQVALSLGAHLPICKMGGLGCSWLLGAPQWETQPAPRYVYLTESWLPV